MTTNEENRTRHAWGRLELWLTKHLPSALKNLRPPAQEQHIRNVKLALGRNLPDALRVSLLLHDGEENNWPPGIFPDGHWFLPVSEILQSWSQLTQLSQKYSDPLESYAQWKKQIEDDIIFVKGNVKPLTGSTLWIPFSDLNGDVQRFLDFDPPVGGTPGQVIESDPEACTTRVLAPSFIDFFETYVSDLESGRYRVEDECIVTPNELIEDVTTWGIPPYLR